MEPGLVPDRPLMRSRARSGASIRSIVAAEMRSSFARTSGANALSPVRSKTSMISGRNGARRFPAGAPSSAQMNPKASPTSWP